MWIQRYFENAIGTPVNFKCFGKLNLSGRYMYLNCIYSNNTVSCRFSARYLPYLDSIISNITAYHKLIALSHVKYSKINSHRFQNNNQYCLNVWFMLCFCFYREIASFFLRVLDATTLFMWKISIYRTPTLAVLWYWSLLGKFILRYIWECL